MQNLTQYNLRVKPKTIKFLEESIENHLYDLGLSKDIVMKQK